MPDPVALPPETPPKTASAPAVENPAPSPWNPCPVCKRLIAAADGTCRHCGLDLEAHKKWLAEHAKTA